MEVDLVLLMISKPVLSYRQEFGCATIDGAITKLNGIWPHIFLWWTTTQYWTQYKRKLKICSANEFRKYLALTVELWGIFSEFFGEKIRVIKSAAYRAINQSICREHPFLRGHRFLAQSNQVALFHTCFPRTQDGVVQVTDNVVLQDRQHNVGLTLAPDITILKT